MCRPHTAVMQWSLLKFNGPNIIIIGGCNNLLCIELTIYSGITLYRIPLGQLKVSDYKGGVLISGVILYNFMHNWDCGPGGGGGGGEHPH